MNVRIRLFAPDDAFALVLQPSQLVEAGIASKAMTREDADALCRRGEAWTAFADDGRVLACYGIAEIFPGRQGTAWAMLAEGLGVAAHLPITRFARGRVARSRLARVECLVADDAAGRGAKWARAVGMPREATLACWGAASETIHVHARVDATKLRTAKHREEVA